MLNNFGAQSELSNGNCRRLLIALIVGCILSVCIIVPAELARTELLAGTDLPWLFGMNVNTTPFAILLLALPAFWFAPSMQFASKSAWRTLGVWLKESPEFSQTGARAGKQYSCWILAATVGLVAFLNCWRVYSLPVHTKVDQTFGQLPLAFHDEYSYEFQARTMLAGRLSYPSHPQAARLFDQFHVVNEGRFASRYFPGAGAWLAPFVALGHAHGAQWLATVLTCMFIFGIGRELSCNGVGLLAGLLVACSPGIVLFGNMLLAHQPTMAGLSVFMWSFLRLARALDAVAVVSRVVICRAGLAGAGLSFAMLCRPMSAAGVALPFGIWIACWLVKHAKQNRPIAVRVVTGFAVPLLLGFGAIMAHNSSTTGDAFKTPYQLYTDIYTPRHVYGFNNVANAEPIAPDRVIQNYDQWAVNLDLQLAVSNVYARAQASTEWTVGTVVAVISLCIFLIGAAKLLDNRWWLVLAGIVSIHVAHIPYWYDGIMHWHYVYESGMLLCLIVAAATQLLVRLTQQIDRVWLQVWWASLLCVSLWSSTFDCSPFWNARLNSEVSNVGFAKLKHFAFKQRVAQIHGPAIVLVRHDAADRHIDYVTNDPALKSDVLFARLPAATLDEPQTLALVRSTYPGHRLFVFDAATNNLTSLD